MEQTPVRIGGELVHSTDAEPIEVTDPCGSVRDAGNTREGPRDAVEEMTHLRFVSLQ